MSCLTHHPICVEQFLSEPPAPASGASVHFVGTVRNHHEGKRVARLYYECYESMAERQLDRIINRVKTDYPVGRVRVLHRLGWLEVGEAAVVIEVSSAHRKEAFEACRAVIEEVKRTVPIWKKEVDEAGAGEWVLCAESGEKVL